MKRLLFFSRVAFICNIFFLLAFSITITHWVRNEDIESTIVIMGYVLVALFNPMVNICYLVLLIFRKKFWLTVPAWLITANILFLVMQIFYIVYLNDTQPS